MLHNKAYLRFLILILLNFFCSCDCNENLTNPPDNLNLTGIWQDSDSTMQIDIVHNLQTKNISGTCNFIIWSEWNGSGPISGEYNRPKIFFNVTGTGVGISYSGMLSDSGNSMNGDLYFSKGSKNLKLIRK
jgi:hypothetical protein